jgi:hypothetical protein
VNSISLDGILSITLIERWHPVTSDLGLINASVPSCVDSLQSWHESIGIRYTSQAVSSSFGDALGLLPPLSAESRRKLFMPTLAGWTAFFQSGIQGSDPFPIMSMLAMRLGVLAMRVCVTPRNATWPAVIWEVYAPPELGGDPTLGYRRSIGASNDGGRWVFDQSGAPYSFERLEYYTRPRKRDRFPPELLEEYLAHFDLKPFEDAFYRPSAVAPAVVLERTSRWDSIPPEFTLDQVVAGEPWLRP